MSSFWVHWVTGCSACLLRPGWIWPQQQRLHWELTAQFGASESPESPCFVSIGHTDVTQIYLDDLRWCFCAIPAVVMIEMRLLECFVWSMDPVRLRSIVSFSCFLASIPWCVIFYEDRTMKFMTLRHCFALLRATATWQTVHNEKLGFKGKAARSKHGPHHRLFGRRVGSDVFGLTKHLLLEQYGVVSQEYPRSPKTAC